MGVWGSDEWMIKDSDNLDNIKIVINAYRSILHSISYLSLPITSGEYYYNMLEKLGVKSTAELSNEEKKEFYEKIIEHNVCEGKTLASILAKESRQPLVVPCIFEAAEQNWSENDYIFMWYRLIEEKAKKIVMKDGWQYSNGSSMEFVRAMEMQFGFINPENGMEFFPKNTDLNKEYKRMKKIKVLTQHWNFLYINDGIKLLSHSINNLKNRGFKVPLLEECLAKLWCICIYSHNNLAKRKEKIPYSYKIDWQDEVIKKQINSVCKKYAKMLKKIDEEKWYSQKEQVF